MKIARLFAATLLVLTGLLAFAGAASPHAALKSGSPAEGLSLAAPPKKAELTFEEAATPQPDPINVTRPGGAAWTAGTAPVTDANGRRTGHGDRASRACPLAYKAVSDGGDKVTGSVHFTLTAPATRSSAPPSASEATPGAAAQGHTGGGVPAWVWILIAVVVVVADALGTEAFLRLDHRAHVDGAGEPAHPALPPLLSENVDNADGDTSDSTALDNRHDGRPFGLSALKTGTIPAAGPPAEVLAPAVFRDVFAVDGRAVPEPVDGRPRVLPRELDP
ncbi:MULTISPECIES: copper resistance protein CopC [Actinomycetes]|uniref:copper resistance CopC family protein n=1 Tax=Actinomycetes TaxID=1760 RepID=UPI0001B58075|nr:MULTISPECIES: copper resistance protein CopC [Actinomycetes]